MSTSIHNQRFTERTHHIDAARQACCPEMEKDLLYILRELFAGESYLSALCQGLLSGALGRATVRLYYNSDAQVIGVAILVLDEFVASGRTIGVFRMFTGFLPAYRGRKILSRFFAYATLRYMWRRPFQRFFVFAPILTPSSYSVFARTAPVLYPNPNYETPKEIVAVMAGLMNRYHCTPVPGGHPLVCHRDIIARTPDRPRDKDAQSRFERFFLQVNPNFREGYCLVTCAPTSLLEYPLAAAQLVYYTLKNWRLSVPGDAALRAVSAARTARGEATDA